MSVAFRRESDEEHKEPRFEIPIPAGPNLVTARGLAMTRARVEELEAAIPAEADETRREALRRDLRYWHTRLTTAELAPEPDLEIVALGTRVTFRRNGAEHVLDIVGDDEAEPGAGRVSFSAPLARALLGGMAGEKSISAERSRRSRYWISPPALTDRASAKGRFADIWACPRRGFPRWRSRPPLGMALIRTEP